MNGSIHKSIAVPAMLTVMLIIYGIAICMINFSGVPSFYDTDMYADMYYAVEVWNQKNLFPENWVFGNQLYAFSTPVLAAVFYGISGSPLRGEKTVEFALEAARSKGVSMELEKYFPASDVYLYTAPVNMLKLFEP